MYVLYNILIYNGGIMNKNFKLDKYEEEIEENYKDQPLAEKQKALKEAFKLAAKNHLHDKKSITIRIATKDIEAVKIKASKYGIPYQTYINMLIHKDVTSL